MRPALHQARREGETAGEQGKRNRESPFGPQALQESRSESRLVPRRLRACRTPATPSSTPPTRCPSRERVRTLGPAPALQLRPLAVRRAATREAQSSASPDSAPPPLHSVLAAGSVSSALRSRTDVGRGRGAGPARRRRLGGGL